MFDCKIKRTRITNHRAMNWNIWECSTQNDILSVWFIHCIISVPVLGVGWRLLPSMAASKRLHKIVCQSQHSCLRPLAEAYIIGISTVATYDSCLIYPYAIPNVHWNSGTHTRTRNADKHATFPCQVRSMFHVRRMKSSTTMHNTRTSHFDRQTLALSQQHHCACIL